MAISKVTLNGETLMDVTSDTVEANNLLSGNTATKNDGTKVIGTATSGVDTSDSNATNTSIRHGSYAYVDGERVTGLYDPNLAVGTVFNSSSITQKILPPEAHKYVEIVSATMTLSNDRFVYDLGTWTSSLTADIGYNVDIVITINDKYYSSRWIYINSSDALPTSYAIYYEYHNDGDDEPHYLSKTVHLTSTQIYIEADDSTDSPVLTFVVADIEQEGYMAFNINPYTLVEKTVNPSRQTQVIRSSTKISSIGSQFFPYSLDPLSLSSSSSTITYSGKKIIFNYGETIDMVVGTKYRIDARFRRQYDGLIYLFNALVVFDTFPINVVLSNPSNTETMKLQIKNTQAVLTALDNMVSNKTCGFSFDISTETIEADALGQVTINPISLLERTVTPSTETQEILPTGDSSIYTNEDNVSVTFVWSSPKRQYISLTWEKSLVVGETYNFHVIFNRRSYASTAYYTYDGSMQFTGFPFTIRVYDSSQSNYRDLSLTETELAFGRVSDDDGTNYMTLTITSAPIDYDGLSKVTVNPISLLEKTVTPSSQVQIVTAGTETVENLIGFSGTSEGSDTTLTITKNGETIGQTYTTNGRTNTVIYDKDAGKQYKVWFRIKKWFFGPTGDYEYGTPLEFEVIDTFYSNGNYKDIIIPVNDPDGVITSIRVNRETYSDIRLIFSGGSSIPSGKNYIKYVSNIYSVEEAHYDALSQVTVNAIPSEYVVPTGTLAISQNGTVNVKNYEYANVNVEGGGGTTADESLPVRFLDYDGTVVYSYTAEDFANLTAMPSNPSHTGLTAQGWNWTLADAKTYVAEYGMLEIGQMYITDDGKTRIYVDVTEYTRNPTIRLGVNGTIVVDWGDGLATDTLTGTSLTVGVTATHEYLSAGKYIISLNVTSGTCAVISYNSAQGLFYTLVKNSSSDLTYSSRITKIEFGDNIIVGASYSYAFCNCINLKTITLPNSVSSLPSNLFSNCYSLQALIIPSTVTSLGYSSFYRCYALRRISSPSNMSINSSVFDSCYSLERVTLQYTSAPSTVFYYCCGLDNLKLPNNITSIGASFFAYCYNLSKIEIPDTVTTIGNSVFDGCNSLVSLTIPAGVASIGNYALRCSGIKEFHFLPTTPPTLGGTSVFAGVSVLSHCIFYVPAESLEAYKTATNWSTYADYMVGE